ncbi:hypothetical protein [Kitasatospora sp. NPDC015120]|uniref:hypothetical protein n=1 Tax=Kitasatospora sp. NPDC015120 TaxID=3364023 RepID=UPI0036F4AF45
MTLVASHGRPGAGKSTFTSMLAEAIAAQDCSVTVVKLGAPLYELQAHVYRAAGLPAPQPGQQDGALLNALGQHLRRINPDALTSAFATTVTDLRHDRPDLVILCDDMRPADTAAMRALGAVFVHVWAPDDIRHQRKDRRGDLSAGSDTHPTEGDIVDADHRVENTGSLAQLRDMARVVAREVLS